MRPRLVDRAAALLGVEEAADLAEMFVGLAAHLELAVLLVLFSAFGDELLLGLGEADAEVVG